MTDFINANGVTISPSTWIANSCGIRGTLTPERWKSATRSNPGIVVGVNSNATYRGHKRELVTVNSKNGPIQLLMDHK